MLGTAWIALFKRIPDHFHDNLTVVMTTGMVISMQTILRLEEDYMVVRGRLGGTADAGRIIIVPYDQLNYLQFTRIVSEAFIRHIHGEEVEYVAELTQKEEARAAEAPPMPLPGASATPGGTPSAPLPPPVRPLLADRLRSKNIPPKSQPPSR